VEILSKSGNEISTPMKVVFGMSDLLLDSQLTEVQHKLAVDLRESAQSLLTIINDILDFSKIEAGKLTLEKIEFNLSSLIEGTTDLMTWKAHDKQLSLMTFISPELPEYYLGDPGRIRQVILNLLSNAVKFTNRGEIVLKVVPVNNSPTETLLRIEVSDTGIGIAADKLNILFKPFNQADGTMTRKFGGTGLGLAISKHLVELMGGEIGVESQPDQGSTFWFTLKLDKSAKDEALSWFTNKKLAGIKVLVLEQGQHAPKILLEYLRAMGLEVSLAYNNSEAMALLEQAQKEQRAFQVILLDINLRDLNAIEFVTQLKSVPQETQLKIIMLTDFLPQLNTEALNQLGFAAYLLKPVKAAQLYDCLATVMTTEKEPAVLIANEPQAAAQAAATQDTVTYKLEWAAAKFIFLFAQYQESQKLSTSFFEKIGINKG